MSSGQTSLEQMLGVYKWVVDDVIKNVREDFLNEGADTQVLEDLKQLWENKLVQSGALSRPAKSTEPHPHKGSPDKHSGKSTTTTNTSNTAGPPPPLNITSNTNNTSTFTNITNIASNTSSGVITASASVIQQAPPRPPPTTTPTTSPALVLPPPPLVSASSSTPASRPVTMTTVSNNTSSPVVISSKTPPPASTSSMTVPPTTLQVLGNSSPSQTTPLIGLQGQAAALAAAQQAALYQSLTSAMSTGATPVAANPLQSLMIPGASLGALSPGLSLIQHGGIPYAAVPTPNGLTYVPIALNLPTAAPLATTLDTSSQNIPQSDGPLPPPTITSTGQSLVATTTPDAFNVNMPTGPFTEPLEPPTLDSTDSFVNTKPFNIDVTGPHTITDSTKVTRPLTDSTGPSTSSLSKALVNSNDSILFKRLTPKVILTIKPPRRRRQQRAKTNIITQLDGPPDGSSSEESDDSSESEIEDDFEEEQLNDEEPLNSDDDAESDAEDENVWETDNTIVCQFEKVYRVRSKWKFALKDGIMHLKGHDYIFTKTSGEAEW